MSVSGGWSVRRRTSSLERRAIQEMRDIQYPLLSLKAVTSVYIGRTKEKKG